MGVDPVVAFGLGAFPEFFQQGGHPVLDLSLVTEHTVVDGVEAEGSVAHTAVLDMGRGVAAGEDAGHDLRDDAEAVTLVGAALDGLAADGEDAAVLLLVDDIQHMLGVAAGSAVLVSGPAGLQFPATLVVNFDLAPRHHGGGHVEPEIIGLGGHAQGQGAGAQHGGLAEGGDGDGLGVGGRGTQQIFIRRHLGVVTGDAVVVAVADGDSAEAVLFGLGDSQLHSHGGSGLAHGLGTVDDGGELGLKDDLRLCGGIHQLLHQRSVVADHPLYAVGLDAVEVGGEDDVHDPAAFFFVEAVLLEHVLTEAPGGRNGKISVTHNVNLLIYIARFAALSFHGIIVRKKFIFLNRKRNDIISLSFSISPAFCPYSAVAQKRNMVFRRNFFRTPVDKLLKIEYYFSEILSNVEKM